MKQENTSRLVVRLTSSFTTRKELSAESASPMEEMNREQSVKQQLPKFGGLQTGPCPLLALQICSVFRSFFLIPVLEL